MDLKMLMAWLDSGAGAEFGGNRSLYIKAFATAAFCLFSRADKLINLQHKDIRPHQISGAAIPFHEFTLTFGGKGQAHPAARHYRIPHDPKHPEIDCYTHMARWLARLAQERGSPPPGDDYIFPALSSTGILKFGEATNRAELESMLDDVVTKSGILADGARRFATRSLRRGGIMYRFGWAERKMSLKMVQWWTGWSSNEENGTNHGPQMSYTDILMGDYNDTMADRSKGQRGLMPATASFPDANPWLSAQPLSLEDVLQATPLV
ncbi:hypothetical protein CERSUDRAFT_100858 [Gelatoporia subvermispora B]|uniref:Uncharacterized protein n=1 Tax=Ceriporiopsis subvermispora (strain B) TaxID=914234 RepID=M2QWS0_CERS8|nr:hypothetical protein CERSUDRAFT_100858 [Gelatoporia subvermispora B]